ncbi:MAG: ACT domain-containing protein [Frankiaceae bacterium]|nr:ACT domain-containing protein [Frankiaceae bacterium]MBV9369604.1 ACT domain-containing protein [Frankiales bacterium]
MPAHLRVSLADRPGALAALTRALAAAGANVVSMSVLQREGGRAVDDLLLDWPFNRPWDGVVRAVEGCQGARLHGLRHVAATEAHPDTDVVQQVIQQPHRAMEILVDALPAALLADWAAVSDRRWPREPVVATPHSPLPLPLTPTSLPRPLALTVDDAPLLALPCREGPLRLIVGRAGGPGFTRSERDRCATLLAVVTDVVRLAYAEPSRSDAAAVTARLLDAKTATNVG